MIRVLCVDDHEAVRAGLEGLVRTEPGLVTAGSASGEGDLWAALQRMRWSRRRATSNDLFQVIREVCRAGSMLPPLTPRRREIAARRLTPEDLPVLSMALDDTPHADIA